MIKSANAKKCCFMILVRTHTDKQQAIFNKELPENVIVIDSYELQNELILEKLHDQSSMNKERQAVEAFAL